MRARPKPNRRRGLIRAAIVIAILVALLIAAMLIVSSLLASPAQAPTAPVTPGVQTPVATPVHAATPLATASKGTVVPGVPTATPPVATPSSRPHPAKTPVKDVALGAHVVAPKHSAASVLKQLASRKTRLRRTSTAQWIAVFAGSGDAYQGQRLLVRRAGAVGSATTVGRADPYVRPVWATNQQSLYFVRVHEISALPGAEWSLWRWDQTTGKTHLLLTSRSLGLIPLGVSGSKFLYIVSRPADSIIETLVHGTSRFLTTLISQPVSSAYLAPNGSSVAFAVPSSCSVCTVDIYDLKKLWIWYGPSGAPSELDVAWLADGSSLLTYRGQDLVTLSDHAVATGVFAAPGTLPRRWNGPLRAQRAGTDVRLTDLASGHSYLAHRSGAA